MNPVLSARLSLRNAHAPVVTRVVEEEGKIIFARYQDCTPVAEIAKGLHNAGEFGSGEMRHAAKIPNVLIEQYCNKHGITYGDWIRDPEHIRRMCNDPDNAVFRIWKGKL